jgi:quinol-cytochrome oxidoreductase complex cytochrome b subunit
MGDEDELDIQHSGSRIGYVIGLLIFGITIPLAKEIGLIGFVLFAVIAYVVGAIIDGYLDEKEEEKPKKRKKKKSKIGAHVAFLTAFFGMGLIGLFIVPPIAFSGNDLNVSCAILLGYGIIMLIVVSALAEGIK